MDMELFRRYWKKKENINNRNWNIVSIFNNFITGINSIAILPYAAKMYDKIYEGTIEAQELKKKLVFIIILIILGIFLECGYMKDIQQGILNIAKK